MPQELLRLDDLTVQFRGIHGLRPVLDRASLSIMPGETTALVGESGSGKTLLARAIMGLLPAGAEVTGGRLWFKGQAIDLHRPDDFRSLRGREIGLIFQEPLSSLNPALRIGLQLTEGLRFHRGLSAGQCRLEAIEMLGRVRIADAAGVLGKYPHELSGGMRQRVMIATALMMKPALLIADEPTTALDMIVQEEVLLLLKEVARDLGTAVLLITHDLSAVALLADHASVMNKGVIVEADRVSAILKAAKNPYTRKLLAATPQPKCDADDARPPEAPLLEVNNLGVNFATPAGLFGLRRREVRVLDGVSFAVAPSETLAIIGESGSGKTTLSRSIAGLQRPSSGDIRFKGEIMAGPQRKAGQRMQFVFQDPFGSLDPRMRVGDIVSEGLLFAPGVTADARRDKAMAALRSVELNADCADRFPHQLSGGQRQRVSIARAIVMNPDFILADEPVSALDLTVQKQVLDLLLGLKKDIGFACLFVSHDLGVVEHIADRVGVLYRGRLVEIGPRAAVFNRPRHPYTRQLLSARGRLVPAPDGSYSLSKSSFARPDMDGTCFEPGHEPAALRYQEVEAGHLVAVSG